MMGVDEHYIPHLVPNCSYVRFNQHTYTLCIDDLQKPIKLNVNHFVKELLDEIDGVKNIEQLTAAFNQKSDVKLSVTDTITIFTKQLSGYGILRDDSQERLRITDGYIKFKITLIPFFVVRKITPLFLALFHKEVFYAAFASSLVLLAGVFMVAIDPKEVYQSIDPNFLVMFMVIHYSGLLLHEFGHAAACDRFGARSGAIGFGFYVFTPVFYSDVTDAWRLSKEERIIVDLGGIYIQVLMCACLSILFLVTSQRLFATLSYLIALSVLINLNPFLRYDGYWALSDSLAVANLRSRSIESARLMLGRIAGMQNRWQPTRRTIFLATYGLLSVGFLVLFLVYMVLFNYTSVIYFPYNLYLFLENLFTWSDVVSFSWFKDSVVSLAIPGLFYYLLIKSVYKKIFLKYFPRHEKP
jgi:putative peptide zinc metalloprotease protein